MEGAGGTASLRKEAPQWSLAGDKQLLDLLQNIHERIVNKCQEANSSLEEMVNNLNSASISVQNVNNRLMALSNAKFVESRVYDDDVDVATQEPAVKEPPKPPEQSSELSKLRDSLRVLESYHEQVHILDSDSDSTSDDEEDRMVLRPKDLYVDRPLPYIIGSQQWRAKWHSGLVVEDSDTDSDISKVNPHSEQYSDSEPDAGDAQMDKPHVSQRTISTTSSIGSEPTIPTIPTVSKPADVAAELARRLGGNVPRIPEPEPESESPPPTTAPTKVYRPQEPVTATIFSEEPPPLDAYQSDQSYRSESDDDVFAELHRNSAHSRSEPRTPAAEQLFGNMPNVYSHKGALEDVERRQPNPSAKRSSPLFDDEQHSDLFAERQSQPLHTETRPDTSVKKPVGGISLFGNNQGAESIGAAILKRNQRKISTSDEEIENINYTEHDEIKSETENNLREKLQKDIINDLFSKSMKSKPLTNKVNKMSTEKLEKPENKKVDLFTDDLFDDIDDIFTNVKPIVKETKKNTKQSLFDDDEDNIFTNVGVSKNKISSESESKSKSIFDSNDDLFNEQNEENNSTKVNSDNKVPLSSSSTSADRLFSGKSEVVVETIEKTKLDQTATEEEKSVLKNKDEHGKKDSKISDSKIIYKEIKPIPDKSSINPNKVKSIFDSDNDEDIFSDFHSKNNKITNTQLSKHSVTNTDRIKKIESESMIDDYEIEDNLFLSKDLSVVSKIVIDNDSQSKNNEIKLNYDKSELADDDDSLFKQIGKGFSREPLIQNNYEAKINVDIHDFVDNGKGTDEKTETVENSPVIKSDKLINSENKLLPKIKNSHLQNEELLKTQYQDPLLFDDDLDDIFTKNPKSNKSKDIRDEFINNTSNLNQWSKETNNEDIIVDNKSFHSNQDNTDIVIKTDVNIASNENRNALSKNTVENVAINNEILIENKIMKDEGISKNIKHEADTNLTNYCSQSSEVSNEKHLFIPKETVQKDEKEDKTEYDHSTTNFTDSEPLLSETEKNITSEPDILSDIFSDVPPEFERPKEPKKSKNVNALFDDDSDDETLFFKKNDIVSDEKPDVSFICQDDKLFHIFHDEPPAIDVDFTQKPKKSLQLDTDTPSTDVYPETITSKTKTYEQNHFESKSRDDIKKEPNAAAVSQLDNMIDDIKKPIGKLKPTNFNINVGTLLPGASPKKIKTSEQVDGSVISIKSTVDVAINDDLKIVKSVSFEGDPESEVLDNKLSKERAKIQVKRRPSSRKARKEAVRKSGIDFGDDSTDNSSSTDISNKDKVTNKYDIISDSLQNDKVTDSPVKLEVTIDEVIANKTKSNNNIINKNAATTESKFNRVIEKTSQTYTDRGTDLLNNDEYIRDNDNAASSLRKEVNANNGLSTAFSNRSNVKSKVVYILNDEDIFTDTKTVTNALEHVQKDIENRAVDVINDEDDLFKASTSKSTNISTVRNVYKDDDLKRNEIDNFDSDEDIFKASQNVSVKSTEFKPKSRVDRGVIDEMESKIDKLFVKSQSARVNASLFDDLSDDESELFGSKKSVKKSNTDSSAGISNVIRKEVTLPKRDVKGPLFGDESDDDHLFNVKTNKKEVSQHASKPKEVTMKATEPVFEDPLSMLGQEDDI